MKKFSFILIVALAVLASCENNKKQCYQFTTKVAGQTVTTYDNCTKAVAEETVKQLKAKGASSASYKVVDSSKCNGNSSSTEKATCWCAWYTKKLSIGTTVDYFEAFNSEADAYSYAQSKRNSSRVTRTWVEKCDYCSSAK